MHLRTLAFISSPTETTVVRSTSGADVYSERVMIPASLISDTFVKDLSVYNGKEVTFVITEYDPKNRKIIGDCKQLIVAAKKAAAEAVLSVLRIILRDRKSTRLGTGCSYI